MNTPKKNAVLNNGWILCPSKTFPGKFYYFNVASGEAVWTLNSNEVSKFFNIYQMKRLSTTENPLKKICCEMQSQLTYEFMN